ncbi:hypothetical protein GCM10027168_00770 [Streptomyces capparidis]
MQCEIPCSFNRQEVRCDDICGRRRHGPADGARAVPRSALCPVSQDDAAAGCLPRPSDPRVLRVGRTGGAWGAGRSGFNGARLPGCHPGAAVRAVSLWRGARPMVHIAALQTIVTDDFEREPTAAELDAIDREAPVIAAEVELLDVRISLLDRPVYPLDARRLRRAEHRLLTERARLSAAARRAPQVTA